MEENRGDETTVATTTQESLDGICEKAMRIASMDELETGRSAGRWSCRGAANDKTQKAHELVGTLVGQITKEGDIVVASDSMSKAVERPEFEASNTKLEHEMCRRCVVESVHRQ